MGPLGWILAATMVGGLGGVAVAAIFLVLPGGIRKAALPALLSFATGSLLGGAFLGLIPHALAGDGHGHGSPGMHNLGIALLAGLLGFFIVEKFLIFRHCHTEECEAHVADEARAKASGSLILLGDTVHNFIDGVVVGAAFLVDWKLGITTMLAVAAHEIPQEVADFAILLHGGWSRAKALLFNALSGLATVLGGLVAYAALHAAEHALPYVLAVAAANFIYVALADLIPTLHRRVGLKATALQLTCIAAGMAMILLAERMHHHAH